MSIEKKWAAVAPKLFTVDGNVYGIVSVADTSGIKVKQRIVISASTLPNLQLQVKRVISNTQFIVGAFPTKVGESLLSVRADLSAYTIALGSYVYAEEQDKSNLKPDDIWQAVYEQEPAVAIRTLPVDEYGRSFGSANPMPVSVTGDVTLNDPIKISGTENGQPNGPEFTFVNNLRIQILAAKDRDQALTYADFGNKNQRITVIDYTAPSIGAGAGFTARKTISYVLDGNQYRKTNITWSLV